MRVFDGAAASGTATSAAFTLKVGGYYLFSAVCGAWNSATVQVEMLGPDGATYVTLGTALSANGANYIYLPNGSYKFLVTNTPTDPIYAQLQRIPGE